MPYPDPMHPAELSHDQIADLLDAAFRQDQGAADEGPDPAARRALADYLGCHEEARDEAWERWRRRLAEDPGVNLGDAEYWLDVEFVEPCPS